MNDSTWRYGCETWECEDSNNGAQDTGLWERAQRPELPCPPRRRWGRLMHLIGRRLPDRTPVAWVYYPTPRLVRHLTQGPPSTGVVWEVEEDDDHVAQ